MMRPLRTAAFAGLAAMMLAVCTGASYSFIAGLPEDVPDGVATYDGWVDFANASATASDKSASGALETTGLSSGSAAVSVEARFCTWFACAGRPLRSTHPGMMLIVR